jgi:hypothetical protein
MHPHHPMKPFAIPADWTTEQALAVVDLLDELRCHIWARYERALQQGYRDLCRGEAAADPDRTEPFADDPIDF